MILQNLIQPIISNMLTNAIPLFPIKNFLLVQGSRPKYIWVVFSKILPSWNLGGRQFISVSFFRNSKSWTFGLILTKFLNFEVETPQNIQNRSIFKLQISVRFSWKSFFLIVILVKSFELMLNFLIAFWKLSSST